jgi:hypothetical protein
MMPKASIQRFFISLLLDLFKTVGGKNVEAKKNRINQPDTMCPGVAFARSNCPNGSLQKSVGGLDVFFGARLISSS